MRPITPIFTNFGLCWASLATLFGAVSLPLLAQTADSFNPGPSSFVYATAVQKDGGIIIGGEFQKIGTNSQPYLARLTPEGKLDATWRYFFTGNSMNVAALAIQEDGKVLVGGNFYSVNGNPRNSIARLNQDGTLDLTYKPRGANGSVWTVCIQPDRKVLVGGSFVSFNGQNRSGLVRLDESGQLDSTFQPSVKGDVYTTMLLAHGQILIGGTVAEINGRAVSRMARLNSDGTVDTNFTAGADLTVNCFALQPDGRMLLGGEFTRISGTARNHIARLKADGSLDENFNPGAGGVVDALFLQADGKIVVAGQFLSLAKTNRVGLGRLNPDGTLDSTLTNVLSGNYSVLTAALQPDGKLLAGGWFTAIGGAARNDLGRLINTEPATGTLAVENGRILWLRGGTAPDFTRADFAVSTNGIEWTGLGPAERVPGGWQLDGVELPATGVIRGRGFLQHGLHNASGWFEDKFFGPALIVGQPVGRTNGFGSTTVLSVNVVGSEPLIFQWQKDGELLSEGPNVSGTASAMLSLTNLTGAEAGGYSVVVSNAFGAITNRVADLKVVDPLIITQPLSQASEIGGAANFTVTAIGTAPLTYQWQKEGVAIANATDATLTLNSVSAADRGNYDVLVSNIFGVTRSLTVQLARPAVVDSFNPATNARVMAVAVQGDGKIVLAGSFTSFGGLVRGNLARVQGDGAVDEGFNPMEASVSASVTAIFVQADNHVLVGGTFGSLGGQPCTNIGRLKKDGTRDEGFSAVTSAAVHCFCPQADGKILIGGDFTVVDGASRQRLARLNPDGSLDDAFSPVANGPVYSVVVQPEGMILVGGSFRMLAGQSCTNLGRLYPDGTPDPGFLSGPWNGITSVALQSDGRIVVAGGNSTKPTLCRLYPDGSLDASFAPSPDNLVRSIVQQADGKLIVGGFFRRIGGASRNYLARLNADGTLDPSFTVESDVAVDALALQGNGSLLAGSASAQTAGWPMSVGRIINTDDCRETLACEGGRVFWARSGVCPEISQVRFDYSTDGREWIDLSPGKRVPGGWETQSAPPSPQVVVRARGFVGAGSDNRSGYFVQTFSRPILVLPEPLVSLGSPLEVNAFGPHGAELIVEASETLQSWNAIATNYAGASILNFMDVGWTNTPARFFRARTAE